MVADAELFFARRLGYGLREGETLGPDIRDWAVRQISEVPALDFYGPGGTNIRDHFADFAEPVLDFTNGTRLWGVYANKEQELQKKITTMEPDAWHKMMEREVWYPQNQYPPWRDCLIRSLTAVNGPSPVFERFWSFWVNHFSVNANQFTKLLYGPHTRAIRNRMTGKFGDMLHDAVLNPSMLYYLDNWLSTGPHSPAGLSGKETINENLARELLELHTMSPAAKYTQDDVIQVAYALSGWSFYGGEIHQIDIPKSAPFGTYFNSHRHEPGSRIILGKTYPPGKNNGSGQALQLLADLAARPETAQFLATKLVRHFVADEPPADSVARVAAAWTASGGDLPTVHKTVIDEVLAKAPDSPKFLTPEDWVYQAHRVTGVAIPETIIWDSGGPSDFWMSAAVEALGQPFGESPQPNGWSDLQGDWISKVLLERRARYAWQLGKKFSGASVEFLKDFAARLTGAGSPLLATLNAGLEPSEAVAVLLSSPAFMWS